MFEYLNLSPNLSYFLFSVNHIASLSDFQYCRNLQELFVRKNNIKSLTEILWLRDLQKLRNLWLAENPCAEGNYRWVKNIRTKGARALYRYRQTVIRNLPQLEKLDNMAITPEERVRELVITNVGMSECCRLKLPGLVLSWRRRSFRRVRRWKRSSSMNQCR